MDRWTKQWVRCMNCTCYQVPTLAQVRYDYPDRFDCPVCGSYVTLDRRRRTADLHTSVFVWLNLNLSRRVI